ncbi:AhpC/TSA antioxidant enzyme [Ceratobasidium sp. AG-Ba]|nr:AhpC/TSA antioxidant enzyme [Ceratobasidium sp. AG-Ba]
MSYEPQPRSATRPGFCRHRRHSSSVDSYYTCGTPPHPLGQARPPPHSEFQPPPPHQTSHVLSNKQNNLSQSSLGHSSSYHSTSSRYPEPYTTDPFLPLQELRRLRSNEQLASFQPQPSVSLPRPTRKLPPTLTLDGLDSNFNIPFPAVADLETPQGRNPEMEPLTAIRPIAELFAGSPMSQSVYADLGSSKSDLPSACTSYMSPPIEFCPATTASNETHPDPRSNVAGLNRTMSIAERRATDLSDVSPALQFMFGVGVPVNGIESRRVNISQSPACNEATVFIWDSQEQTVAYGGIGEPETVGNTELDSTKSQTSSDSDKTPTNELVRIPWPSVSAPSTGPQRKRPAPIYVGNQVQRSTVTQTEMAPAPRSNRENLALKTDSLTSINDDARSRKESEASQFSLSMFPATPTTPIHADVLRAAINSTQSPFCQTFSPGRQSLSASPACLAPPPLTSRSLQFPLASPVRFPRSAPSTPIRRETIEIDQRLSTSYVRQRTEHALANSPVHQHERNRAVSIASKRSDTFPAEPDHSLLAVTVTQPSREIVCEAPVERNNSVCSHSVYSQDQPLPQRRDSDSESCYSDDLYIDDASSMSSSVAEAIMMAQAERRWSRQSRLAYLRDSFATGSGREPSLESHLSSSSSSASAERSGIPVTPEDEERYLEEEKGAAPIIKYPQRDALVPSVNIIPPTRKPVPRLSTILEPAPYNPPILTPRIELRPLRTASSMHSLRSPEQSRDRSIISHSHMYGEHSPGPDSLPHGASRTTLTTDGGVGVHSLAHSKSMSALRPSSAVDLKVSEKSKAPKPPFDKYGMPTLDQLKLASEMHVFDEFGESVRFGDVFEGQKTAVCFIRHFWCPLCQDYMSSIVHLTEPSLVKKAGVKLVIIGNGSPSMIKGYREDIFQCPYEMYTDPSRQLYKVLGMHLRTNDGGSEEEKGSYVRHGTFTGTLMVLKNALKMPLANAGDIKQLGGEFILGPGRMHTTRSHTPIRDLLEAAGVDTKPWATDLSFLKPGKDQARWMDVQNEDLDRLIRRGLQQATNSCNLQLCALDEDVTGTGELDLGEFCRLVERLKNEVEDPIPIPTPPAPLTPPESSLLNRVVEYGLPPQSKVTHPAPVTTSSYEIEVKGHKRVELDHLGAVLQSRNGSSTWEACRVRKQSSSRPGTANSRPGTANSRPGTAKSTASYNAA